MHNNTHYRSFLTALAARDAKALIAKDEQYGGSWMRRGGQGAYYVAVRKWDRIEVALNQHHFDVFAAIEADRRPEGIIDDIRDFRGYLSLWEAEMVARGVLPKPTADVTSEDHLTSAQLGEKIRTTTPLQTMSHVMRVAGALFQHVQKMDADAGRGFVWDSADVTSAKTELRELRDQLDSLGGQLDRWLNT